MVGNRLFILLFVVPVIKTKLYCALKFRWPPTVDESRRKHPHRTQSFLEYLTDYKLTSGTYRYRKSQQLIFRKQQFFTICRIRNTTNFMILSMPKMPADLVHPVNVSNDKKLWIRPTAVFVFLFRPSTIDRVTLISPASLLIRCYLCTQIERVRVKFTLRFTFTKTSKMTRFSIRIDPAVCNEISRYWIMPEYRTIIMQTPKSYPTDGNSLGNVFFLLESYRQFIQNVRTLSLEYAKISRNYPSKIYCSLTCFQQIRRRQFNRIPVHLNYLSPPFLQKLHFEIVRVAS